MFSTTTSKRTKNHIFKSNFSPTFCHWQIENLESVGSLTDRNKTNTMYNRKGFPIQHVELNIASVKWESLKNIPCRFIDYFFFHQCSGNTVTTLSKSTPIFTVQQFQLPSFQLIPAPVFTKMSNTWSIEKTNFTKIYGCPWITHKKLGTLRKITIMRKRVREKLGERKNEPWRDIRK